MSNNHRVRTRNRQKNKRARKRNNWARVSYGRSKRQGSHYRVKIRKNISLTKIVTATLAACIVVAVSLLLVNIVSVKNSNRDFQENSPTSVLEELETSFNDGDADRIIECLDPNSQKIIRDSSKVVGAVIDLGDFIDVADVVLSYSRYVDCVDSDDFEDSSIRIVAGRPVIINDQARIKATTRYYYAEKLVSENDDVFYFIKYEGKWYIDGSDLVEKFINKVR